MRKLNLEEIQKEELKILLEFKAICDKYSIKMFLDGGTLLGAVRHGGFIPWDDDIDVSLSRTDYERFRKLVKTENVLPPHLKMICGEDGNFHFPFMKIINTNIEVDLGIINEENHLWIDIFPLDGVLNDPKRTFKIQRKIMKLRKIIFWNYAKSGTASTKFKALVRPVLICFAKIYGADRALKKIFKISKRYSYDESEYVCNLVFGIYCKGEVFRKSVYETLIEIPFEGYLMPVMKEYEKVLVSYYGDWKQLPPENQRITHGMNAWFVNE